MEDFVLIGKLQRIISQRHEDIVTAMASGAVDNMEKYQYMLTRINRIKKRKRFIIRFS